MRGDSIASNMLYDVGFLVPIMTSDLALFLTWKEIYKAHFYSAKALLSH